MNFKLAVCKMIFEPLTDNISVTFDFNLVFLFCFFLSLQKVHRIKKSPPGSDCILFVTVLSVQETIDARCAFVYFFFIRNSILVLVSSWDISLSPKLASKP